MTFQTNGENKNDADMMMFWVINNGSNVWNQGGVGNVAGRSVSPAAAQSLQPESRVGDTSSGALIPLHFNEAGLTGKENVYEHL